MDLNVFTVCVIAHFCRFRTVRARLLFTRRPRSGSLDCISALWLTGLKSSKHLHLFMPTKDVVVGCCAETGLEQAQVLSFVFNISNVVLLLDELAVVSRLLCGLN